MQFRTREIVFRMEWGLKYFLSVERTLFRYGGILGFWCDVVWIGTVGGYTQGRIKLFGAPRQ